MPSDIILIGPLRAGKSTVGRLLAEKLNVPQVALVVYTQGRTPEATCDEILSRVSFEARER